MNDTENTTLIFESLVDITIQRKQLTEVETLLREQLQKQIETMPLTAEYRGYITYLAKNSPSRRMNYAKLEKDYDDLYQWLVGIKVLTVSEPKTQHRLVVSKPKKKGGT